MKKVLIIDNYDSFTYNLAHLLIELGAEVTIKRNDQLSLEEPMGYDKLLLSPGPGIPVEAGLLLPIIQKYAPLKPILGVCLGHQAIGECFGGKLTNLSEAFHGVDSEISVVLGDVLFEGLSHRLVVGRYHSWVVDKENFPQEALEITAVDEGTGQIMALRHKEYDVRGIQFHPESVLTPQGRNIIKNWLEA